MQEQDNQIKEKSETTELQNNEGFRKYLTQRNIIIFICAVFAIWILFCDRNSVVRRHQLKKEQEKLIETKRDYQKKINETQKEINALDDDEYIERIAREKHLMKKDNEDIYMVTD